MESGNIDESGVESVEIVEQKKESFGKILQMPARYWVAFLLLIVLGCVFIYASQLTAEKAFENHNALSFVLGELGILLVSIVPMIFIYERILRNIFLYEMEDKIRKNIQDFIPENVNNIRQNGIADIYDKLRYDFLIRKLEKVHNTKIRILKIWIPSMDTLVDCLYGAIVERNCTVEILLCNPDCKEALTKRGTSYDYPYQRIKAHIEENQEDLKDLYRKLPETKKDALQLRLHRDFISVSLIGIENYFITGFYLNGRLATNGTQIKVHGRDAGFYHELYKHFKDQWKHAEKYNFKESLSEQQS
jgi:hypothetical protein